MTIAFVTINVEPGTEKETLKELKKIEGVKEVYIVYGGYDIIAKVFAEDETKLKEIVSGQIRKIDTVNSTGTMPVIES